MRIRQLRPLAWICLLALVLATPALATTDSVNGEVFSLGEVIVTGEEQVVNLATTVTEVTAEDIKARGAQTVAEALEHLPGVDVATGGKGQSYVSVRGFGQGDLKVLIDGVPVYEQYYRSLDLSQLSVDSIAKITVTKGASSVLYGANTMGGVVNIITKKGGAEPHAYLSGAWGDYSKEHYAFNTGATVGKFNYWLGYSYRHSDGFRLSDGGKHDDSGYLQRGFNAKVGIEPTADTKLYLIFDYHDNEKGIPDMDWYFDEWKQWQLSLVGEQRFNEWLRVKARAFYVDHKDTLLETDWDPSDWFYASAYDNYSVGGDTQAFMDLGPLFFLKAGVSFVRDNCEQEEVVAPGDRWQDAGEFEADTYTFALENESKINDWLALTIGASYDYYDPREASDQPVPDSIDAFNPQGGVVVTLSDSTALHASVGKKIRFPHLKELYSKMAGGNPDLDPQETIAYEIGVTHAFSDTISGSAAFFYNDIEDLIQRLRVGRDKFYVNVGQTKIEGFEAELSADVTDSFWVGVNYTYLHTEDKDNDRELEGRPRHRANLDMRYRFPFGLTSTVQLSYTMRQFYEDYDYNWQQGPDFFLVNARLEQNLGEYWGVEGKAFVEVENLTDRDYTEGGYVEPGRNFLAGLRLIY